MRSQSHFVILYVSGYRETEIKRVPFNLSGPEPAFCVFLWFSSEVRELASLKKKKKIDKKRPLFGSEVTKNTMING